MRGCACWHDGVGGGGSRDLDVYIVLWRRGERYGKIHILQKKFCAASKHLSFSAGRRSQGPDFLISNYVGVWANNDKVHTCTSKK